MIALCSGEISKEHLDAMVMLAQQLEARGHHVVIDERFVPDEASRQLNFELAPYIADLSEQSLSVLLVLGANAISDAAQALLHQIRFASDAQIWGLGHFSDLQDEIAAGNRIAYATGREPRIFDLVDQRSRNLYMTKIAPLLTEIHNIPKQFSDRPARVLVYVPYSDPDEAEGPPMSMSQLSELHFSPNMVLHVLTNSRGKASIAQSSPWCSVFGYMELPPLALMRYFDVLVFLGSDVPGQRMATLALNAMGAGKVVIDCTEKGAFAASGAPVLRGPTDQEALGPYLRDTILNNRIEIGRRILQNTWLRRYDIEAFETMLAVAPKDSTLSERTPRRLFFPTNGNGLGHAQRCALIAEDTVQGTSSVFAAFPSCINILRSRGFGCVPMVSRSAEHLDDHAADLLNYLRLRQVLRQGDQLVFDGGFVFDSVYRLTSELDLSATWIRRGLWQPRQINRVALERERAFKNVIVPTEAFDELNADYSSGDHVHKVGPIVQTLDQNAEEPKKLRDRLSVEFDRPIDTLVVSMLGGGVASKRAAHTQLLCSLFENRRNCLHLVVAWPNAIIDAAIYGWSNSFVVRTSRAIELCRAADLCVSAAGYNSFHELIYAGVPAIFVPQSAGFLDDQERRAHAAAERQLATVVGEDQLFKLEREALNFIETGKRAEFADALGKEKLPELGNKDAAGIIEMEFAN